VVNLELIVIIFFSVLVMGSFGIWVFLLFALKKSFDLSPKMIQSNELQNKGSIDDCYISIIIPARNEEKYIKNCITSLLNQNYNKYEIIIVDDNSSDRTLEILKSLKNNNELIQIIQAGKKPKNWVGKNWPCYIGYKNSKGDYLFFTDADTIHSNHSISDSLYTLLNHNLDVLTAVPRLLYPTFIVKMVLPILSIFMFSRYSPAKVNNPKIKLGYLFGSFFVISKTVYEKIGTHESVKTEIVEDGALGQRIKEFGYKLKMYRGEELMSAYWARDFHTLWNSLKRLIIPIYFKNKRNSIIMTIGVFILMVMPFLTLLYSIITISIIKDNGIDNLYLFFLLIASSLAVLSIYLTNYYQLKMAKTHNILYFLGAIIGCIIVSISFIWSIISLLNKGSIKWRDRIYHYGK
jgi:chlorobactene glucosyltransferase